jgi:hypothetical protein
MVITHLYKCLPSYAVQYCAAFLQGYVCHINWVILAFAEKVSFEMLSYRKRKCAELAKSTLLLFTLTKYHH